MLAIVFKQPSKIHSQAPPLPPHSTHIFCREPTATSTTRDSAERNVWELIAGSSQSLSVEGLNREGSPDSLGACLAFLKASSYGVLMNMSLGG